MFIWLGFFTFPLKANIYVMSFQGISITGDNKLMKKVFRRNGEVNLFFNTARTCNESAAVRASAFPKTAAQLPSATGDEGLLT